MEGVSNGQLVSINQTGVCQRKLCWQVVLTCVHIKEISSALRLSADIVEDTEEGGGVAIR